MSGATVAGLAITAIKGTRLQEVPEVELGPRGARENRRFFLIDERGRMVNAKNIGSLQAIVSRYDDGARRLELEFPAGPRMEAAVELGEEISARFFSRQTAARVVLGEFSEAISQHAGQPLRLVEAGPAGGVDRGAGGAVTLISRGSLERLAAEAERENVDARRFRMLIEIDGVDAHEEDGWVGRRVSVGDAVIRGGGHVGRCLITNRNPETGESDLPTLDVLLDYRHGLPTTEPVAFGIYGAVVRPAVVRVGDPVTVQDG